MPLTASLSCRPSTKAPRPHRRAEPCGPRADSSSRGPSGRDELAASSESDAEGPIAAQMLSFVMDDPDFESDSDTPRRAVRSPEHVGRNGGEGEAPECWAASVMPEPRPGCPSRAEGRGFCVLAATLRHCCPLPRGQVWALEEPCHLPRKRGANARWPHLPAPPGRVPRAGGSLRRDGRGHGPCPGATAPQAPGPRLPSEGRLGPLWPGAGGARPQGEQR